MQNRLEDVYLPSRPNSTEVPHTQPRDNPENSGAESANQLRVLIEQESRHPKLSQAPCRIPRADENAVRCYAKEFWKMLNGLNDERLARGTLHREAKQDISPMGRDNPKILRAVSDIRGQLPKNLIFLFQRPLSRKGFRMRPKPTVSRTKPPAPISCISTSCRAFPDRCLQKPFAKPPTQLYRQTQAAARVPQGAWRAPHSPEFQTCDAISWRTCPETPPAGPDTFKEAKPRRATTSHRRAIVCRSPTPLL
jgi:hypothetical protein